MTPLFLNNLNITELDNQELSNKENSDSSKNILRFLQGFRRDYILHYLAPTDMFKLRNVSRLMNENFTVQDHIPKNPIKMNDVPLDLSAIQQKHFSLVLPYYSHVKAVKLHHYKEQRNEAESNLSKKQRHVVINEIVFTKYNMLQCLDLQQDRIAKDHMHFLAKGLPYLISLKIVTPDMEESSVFESHLSFPYLKKLFLVCHHSLNKEKIASTHPHLKDIYLFGYGIGPSHIKIYINANWNNDRIAQCDLGFYYATHEDDQTKALEYYKQAANQGCKVAQTNLGYRYTLGRGCEIDLKQAFEYYKQAANQGNAIAQNSLGNCYTHGRGCEKDLKQAFELYKQSADQSDELGQCNLGNCYKYGLGCELDLKKAFEYYKQAADQGNTDAQMKLCLCYKYGEGCEINLQAAFKYYRKSINKPEPEDEQGVSISCVGWVKTLPAFLGFRS